MADNYLENCMERHLNPGRKAFVAPRQQPKGHIHVPDITAADMERLRTLARQGWRISFGGGDVHQSARLARTMGWTFVPPGMAPPAGAVQQCDVDDCL